MRISQPLNLLVIMSLDKWLCSFIFSTVCVKDYGIHSQKHWLTRFFTCRNLWKKLRHECLRSSFGYSLGWHEYWHAHASARGHVFTRATILGTLCTNNALPSSHKMKYVNFSINPRCSFFFQNRVLQKFWHNYGSVF